MEEIENTCFLPPLHWFIPNNPQSSFNLWAIKASEECPGILGLQPHSLVWNILDPWARKHRKIQLHKSSQVRHCSCCRFCAVCAKVLSQPRPYTQPQSPSCRLRQTFIVLSVFGFYCSLKWISHMRLTVTMMTAAKVKRQSQQSSGNFEASTCHIKYEKFLIFGLGFRTSLHLHFVSD